jgi:hypothetical protein
VHEASIACFVLARSRPPSSSHVRWVACA